ncbi:hypothetical protein ACHABX_04200 [Nesterenkonia halotolerans]|uniref:hypothetical protein n=1 Tax=Nesterenkonia halotolerans TaxID=225325 RepID=UPI003EE71CFA
MTDKKTFLILKGKISYEEEVTVAQAAQIIAFLNTAEGETSTLGTPVLAPEPTTQDVKTKTVEYARDAIVRTGAKTNPEKIVALAAYVLQDGGATVKAEVIKSQFQRAREAVPAKFGRDLSVAITSGWIAEGDGAELYLTKNVENIFDDGFVFPRSNSTGRARSAKKSTAKKTTAKGEKPDTLAEIDEFHAVMDGYPPYGKLKSQKDRLLWILVYMRDKHARKTVATNEIAWISNHIGTGVPSSNIAGAFNSAKGAGYATRSTTPGDNSIKVTDAGAQFLAETSNATVGAEA